MNIPASQNQFHWCFSPIGVLVPHLFWKGFFTSFTDNLSDTILLRNEDLNCRQSESSKAEQAALSSSNIVMLAQKCLALTKAFFIF